MEPNIELDPKNFLPSIKEEIKEVISEETLEYKVADAVTDIVELDIKQLEYYERLIRNLHLEVTLSRGIDQLENVEQKFIDMKDKLDEVIAEFKKAGVHNLDNKVVNPKVYKSVGHYKDEMENQFIVARVTHNSFNIPIVIERIISLELTKESLEQHIDDKKAISKDPSKKWEVVGAKIFNVGKEVQKMKATLDKQSEYVNAMIKTIAYAKPDNQIIDHLNGIDVLTKKLGSTIKAYDEATINKENIVGLSIAVGMTNNLTKGLKHIVTLDTVNDYINSVSYEEEIKRHLIDYTLIEAINDDSIETLRIIKIVLMRLFEGIANNYPLIDAINTQLDSHIIMLEKKGNFVKGANDKAHIQNTIDKYIKI